MNPALTAVAIAIIVGAVVAGSARNARTAVLGLFVTMVGGPLLADPTPEPAGLAARLVGAVLAGYLLWIAARDIRLRTGGSRIGWPSEAFVGIAGGVVGYASHGLGAPAGGPAVVSAAGFALAALSVLPVVTGRDVLRIGLGLGLLSGGVLLIRAGLGGTPDALENLLDAGFVAALGGAVAILAIASRSDGGADLGSGGETPRRSGHPADGRPDGSR